MGDGMKGKWRSGLKEMLFPVLAVAVLLFFLTAVGNLEAGNREEGKKQLEQALQRCAVTCYATEGIYPPDVDYMKEHYGLRIDESRYLVSYEVFAENLMPEITVVERKNEK